MNQLGQILLKDGVISEAQLLQALSLQKLSRTRLGDIIIAKGMTDYLKLYSALAKHYGLEFIDLLNEPPDKNLLNIHEVENYIKLRVIPWKNDNGKIIIATSEYSDETIKWANNRFGKDTGVIFTSPLDIRRTIENMFGGFLEEESKLRLWKKTLRNPRKALNQRHLQEKHCT